VRRDGTLQTTRSDSDSRSHGTFEIGGFNMGNSRKYRTSKPTTGGFVVDDLATVDPWKPRMVEVRGTGE